MYQKWPDQIFPIVNFGFPTMVTLVWGGGEGVLGEGSPPLVFKYSKEALPLPPPPPPCGGRVDGPRSAQCGTAVPSAMRGTEHSLTPPGGRHGSEGDARHVCHSPPPPPPEPVALEAHESAGHCTSNGARDTLKEKEKEKPS